MAKSKNDILHPIFGWQTQKNTLEGFKLPEGELKEIVRVNFGNELLNLVKGVSWIEEIIEKNIEHPLKDGTIIRGNRIRRRLQGSDEQSLENLAEFADYKIDTKDYMYYFIPKTEIIRTQQAYQYRVQESLLFNGILIKEEIKEARIAINTVTKSKRMLWKKKKTDLNLI